MRNKEERAAPTCDDDSYLLRDPLTQFMNMLPCGFLMLVVAIICAGVCLMPREPPPPSSALIIDGFAQLRRDIETMRIFTESLQKELDDTIADVRAMADECGSIDGSAAESAKKKKLRLIQVPTVCLVSPAKAHALMEPQDGILHQEYMEWEPAGYNDWNEHARQFTARSNVGLLFNLHYLNRANGTVFKRVVPWYPHVDWQIDGYVIGIEGEDIGRKCTYKEVDWNNDEEYDARLIFPIQCDWMECQLNIHMPMRDCLHIVQICE